MKVFRSTVAPECFRSSYLVRGEQLRTRARHTPALQTRAYVGNFCLQKNELGSLESTRICENVQEWRGLRVPSASNQDQVLRVPEELSGLGPLSGEAAPRNGFWSMPLQLRRRDAQREEVSFLVLFFWYL